MASREPVVFARLYLPRPLDQAAVEDLLVRLAADPSSALIALEARAVAGDGISWWLGTTGRHLRWVRRTFHDLLPGLVTDADPALGRRAVKTVARVRVRPPGLAMSVARPDVVTRALLSALNQRLESVDGQPEQVVVQVLLGPRRPARHSSKSLPDPTQPWWSTLTAGAREPSSPVRRQHEQRQLQAGFATAIRFGVSAETPERRSRLLAGLLGGFGTAKAPGVHVDLTKEPASYLDAGVAPRRWGMAPAAGELVGLLAWPLGDRELPGLPSLHPRTLLAPRMHTASLGTRVIGRSNVPGDPRPIGISPSDSLYHLVALGPTGSGKTTALLHLIGSDIAARRPVLVLDPKRQLVDDVLDRAVPEQRIGDVVLIDPGDHHVPGFNPLDVGDRDPDVVVDGLLAVFAAVFKDGWGPRTHDIVNSGLLSLARVGALRFQDGGEPFTLLDLPRLFTDEPFRRSVIGHLADDPGLGQFWAWYESLAPAAQAAAIAAPLNKIRQYLLRPSLRRILGQPRPTFRLRDLFTENKVVLIPLNEGLIGPITAQLLGSLVVAEVWAATLERARENEPATRPGSVWIDEAQQFMHLPTASLGDALAASRSMGVSWNLAHQFRAQLPPAMRAAVDSNARNKIVFRPNDPDDARDMARQAPELEPLDFLSLPKYTAYATLVHAGESQPWCSLITLPPPEPTGLGESIRATSRQTYGAPPAPAPDHASAASATPSGPIGRKPRGQS